MLNVKPNQNQGHRERTKGKRRTNIICPETKRSKMFAYLEWGCEKFNFTKISSM